MHMGFCNSRSFLGILYLLSLRHVSRVKGLDYMNIILYNNWNRIRMLTQ